MNTENETEIRNNPKSPSLNEYQPNNVLQNARMAFVQLVKR